MLSGTANTHAGGISNNQKEKRLMRVGESPGQ